MHLNLTKFTLVTLKEETIQVGAAYVTRFDVARKITQCKDVLFDFKLNAQYQQLFAPVAPVQQPEQPAVIKLFDDE